MKLFQQLLVAPAALGLMASGANAAELNINGVSDYAASADQVTSVTQFSDVYPTDWAYQALSNLVEQYGCVAGYPNGTFRGNRAMTRYEAAALLNACLDRVTEVTDEVRGLVAEFETELAILRGRVDGLEARVGELEATQFSTTTKLKGVTNWVLGAANGFDDDASEGVSFNYDLRLTLETSFTGSDMLTTVLSSGNYASNSVWYDGLASLETVINSNNNLTVEILYYTFPIGDNLDITAGPIVYSDDDGMYAGRASFYPFDVFLDFFSYGGTWATNNLETPGAGIGAVYRFSDSGFSASGNYVVLDGNSTGIGRDESSSTSTWQLFYEGEAFNGSFLAQAGFAYAQNIPLTIGTNAAYKVEGDSRLGFSAAAAWMPYELGILPSISGGWSMSSPQDSEEKITGWYLGFEWDDVLIEGNSFGFATGQAPKVSGEYNKIYEAFYKIFVSDNVTVIPAYFIVDNYSGDELSGGFVHGGVVKTVFRF